MKESQAKPGPKPDLCVHCKQPLIKIVRLTNKKTLTNIMIKICRNQNCWAHTDVEKITTWRKLNTGSYKRNFTTQNRPEYNPNFNRFR